MVRYILEVIVFQSVFMLVYELWLRKETFFNVNRAYLLGTVLLAFALPFMVFETFQNPIPLRENIQVLPELVIGIQQTEITTTSVTNAVSPDWSFIALLLYCGGFLLSLVIFLKKYLKIRTYYQFRRALNQNIVVVPGSDEAFTFLNTIFIGSEISSDARSHILAHENVHLQQKHGFDLLLFEVLRLVFWFNPLVYIYQFKIAELHEFIADAQATKNRGHKPYYNQLLNTAFGTQHISFINTFFNQSLIKKRILMLQKTSNKSAKWKYLLVLPFIFGILIYVGCTNDSTSNEVATADELEMQIVALKASLNASGNPSKADLTELKNLEKLYRKKLAIDPTIALNELVMVGYTEGSQVQGGVDESEEINTTNFKTGYASTEIPQAIVDEVPVFPGCIGSTNQERLECMSTKLNQFVNINFNTGLGDKLGLKGVNRVYVRFVVDPNGKVTNIGTRANYPELEKEAKRVIEMLPQMTPAEQVGEAVAIQYSLPIVFEVKS